MVNLTGVAAIDMVGSVSVAPLSLECPVVTLGAGIVVLGEETDEGAIVEAIATPWFELVALLNRDPESLYRLGWRQLEELIAAAYRAAGFDVVLTPRSGDLGRDVIATKKGIVSVRYLEQAKAYKPGHLVTANDVRAMYGVAMADSRCTKAVICTTSDFAPMVREDQLLKPFMPYRLELRSGSELIPWLNSIAAKHKSSP